MKNKISGGRKAKDCVFNILMYTAAGLTAALLIFLIGYILVRGLPHITWKFLSTKPSLVRETVGILPHMIGIGGISMSGLAGMLIFVRFFSLGTSLVAGAATLAVMTLPTVIRTVQESLKTVPQSYREGALALGCGKWYMIRTAVLPSAMDGIVTGCILSIGRVVGESAALLFTAGMANEIIGLFEAPMPGRAGSTLTVALYMYAKERGEFDIAFAIAAILLLITLAINISARLAAKKLQKGKSE